MIIADLIKERKVALMLTILIIIVGTILYFIIKPESESGMGSSNVAPDFFKNLELKTSFSEDGKIKLFAFAKNNDLAKLKAVEGNSIPEKNTIVIGFEEANMMKEEKLFSKVGDEIKGLFGIDVKIGGILKKTNSLVDDFHFVSESEFSNLQGDPTRVYIKLTEENSPDMFYHYVFSETLNSPLNLSEGNLNDYIVHDIAGKRYYPVILGYKDAEEMRDQKEFSKIGDIIEDLNKSFVIVAIAAETNTSFDMMHIIPLTKIELGEN